MKVKEMMEWLKQFNENDDVYFEIDDDGDVWVEGFGRQYIVVEVNGKELKID